MFHRMLRIMLAALICACVIPAIGVAPLAPPAVWAEAVDLETAKQLYDEAKYGEALTRLRDALDSGQIAGNDAIRAREFIARCQVKLQDVAGAQKTFLVLLRQDPLYQPDAARVPPDEMAAFAAAKSSFEAEQELARQRIPASIGLFFGIGGGANSDFGEYVKSGGGDENYKSKPFFGGSVRFPLLPRLSLDLELQRFRATNADSGTGVNRQTYEITSIPLSVSLQWLLKDRPKWRAAVFAGGGPMLQTKSAVSIGFTPTLRLQASDTKVGTYLHGGVEGEYRLHPRLSLNGRVLGRVATASELSIFQTTNFDYTSTVPIAKRDVSFGGFGASVGLRTYIGY